MRPNLWCIHSRKDDVISSEIVTAAMLEVYCVAAVVACLQTCVRKYTPVKIHDLRITLSYFLEFAFQLTFVHAVPPAWRRRFMLSPMTCVYLNSKIYAVGALAGRCCRYTGGGAADRPIYVAYTCIRELK